MRATSPNELLDEDVVALDEARDDELLLSTEEGVEDRAELDEMLLGICPTDICTVLVPSTYEP